MNIAGIFVGLAAGAGLLAGCASAPRAALPPQMPAAGVCAHRGNGGGMPENTTLAWPNAIRLGAQMVELDVKRCRTGELVILHDETVDRTTDGRGRACDMTFAELRALDAGCRKGARIPGCPPVKIPTFEEAIDSIPADAPVWINCHCAANTAVEVARIIRAKGRLNQAFIATSLKAIDEARREVPEILSCNMSRPWHGIDAYRKPWPPEMSTRYARETVEHRCQFLQLLAPCSKADAEMLHAAGVKISYFHCEDPAKVAALLDLGVDFILTDHIETIGPKIKELRK